MRLMKSTSSALWVISAQGSTIFLRFLSTIILTRLLFPEAFGTMLVIGTITSLIQLLSDVGLRGSIINNPRSDVDENYVNTIWTLKIIRGVIIAAIIVVISFFSASIYPNVENLSLYLQITSISALLKGFESTKVHQMERRMEMMRPAVTQIGGRVIALVATIIFAYIHPSALSIVLGEVVSSLGLVLLSHFYLKGTKNKIHIERTALNGIIRYGRWILFSTLLTWTVREGHKFILGLIMSVQTLGFYALGSNIATVVSGFINGFSDRWIFPMYTRLGETDSIDSAALNIRHIFVGSASIGILLLVTLSAYIVDFLYEQTYENVSYFIRVIAIGSIGAIVSDCYVPIYKAKADSFGLMVTRSVQALIIAVAVFFGYNAGGAEGVILASAFAQLVTGPATAFMSRKHFAKKLYLLDSAVYSVPFIILLYFELDTLSVVFQ